jgi:predicted NBD/HSP70 family sugar kinase
MRGDLCPQPHQPAPGSRLCDTIEKRARRSHHKPPFRIGIGAPNANYHRGTVENPVNLNWGASVNLVELFRQRYDLPVAITNDANAAAIGELLFGGARGMKHAIVITLGTGLGSGIIVNGELLYGADGANCTLLISTKVPAEAGVSGIARANGPLSAFGCWRGGSAVGNSFNN